MQWIQGIIGNRARKVMGRSVGPVPAPPMKGIYDNITATNIQAIENVCYGTCTCALTRKQTACYNVYRRMKWTSLHECIK